MFLTQKQVSSLMRVIGGNTNFTGSEHGVGMFLVNRNFLRPPDCKLDFIELIDIQGANVICFYLIT